MGELDVSALLSVPEAIAIIDSVPVVPREIEVALGESQGCRLARDIAADRDYPPFDKSQMDGYAVRCADIATAPVTLMIGGTIAAGSRAERPLNPREVMAIMTGAPLPPGADGVVPVEETEAREEGAVRILQATTPGKYIAPRGSDVRAGATVLKKGTIMGPAQIAVAASVGACRVHVFEPPTVAILGTGDELVPAEETPVDAQIRNSNNPMLVALLEQFRCEVRDVRTVRDDPQDIRHALEEAMLNDVIFVTGGMSMGQFDYVPKLLADMGFDLRITKIRIKPGKPFVFGVISNYAGASIMDVTQYLESEKLTDPPRLEPRQVFVFGLPGNPVSGFVCTVRLASRLLTRLAGGTPTDGFRPAALSVSLPANGPREFYHPAILTGGTVEPLAWKGSADIYTLANANAFIVRAENEPAAAAGAMVNVLEITR